MERWAYCIHGAQDSRNFLCASRGKLVSFSMIKKLSMRQWTFAKVTNYRFQAFAMVCFSASKIYAANMNWNLMRPGFVLDVARWETAARGWSVSDLCGAFSPWTRTLLIQASNYLCPPHPPTGHSPPGIGWAYINIQYSDLVVSTPALQHFGSKLESHPGLCLHEGCMFSGCWFPHFKNMLAD